MLGWSVVYVSENHIKKDKKLCQALCQIFVHVIKSVKHISISLGKHGVLEDILTALTSQRIICEIKVREFERRR